MYCVHCGAPRKGGDPTCEFCGVVFGKQVDAPLQHGGLPSNVMEALRAGNKIGAIKLYREATGLGLKESLDAIEAFERKLR